EVGLILGRLATGRRPAPAKRGRGASMAYPYGSGAAAQPDPRPSINLVRDAWEGGRSVAGGVLLVGLIGGGFVVAPAASWALLRRAAAYLAQNAGRVIAATVLAEVCPECWVYA